MSAKKFKREVLLRAPRFAKYQQDFLGAVLRKSEYTIAEAERANTSIMTVTTTNS